jgi:membrane protein implicated in regulation of membrane protease activity
MNTLVRFKLALVVIGLIIWAWGYSVDDSFLRSAGIVVLLIAFLLRFVRRRQPTPDTPKDEPPAA